jgi:uncharacterized membrane protein
MILNKERFEAFTDAVLAIILTILVLELHLPASNHTLKALIAIAPQFFAYVLTFIFIATIWVNHHYLFINVKVINHRIIWQNIVTLFFASLLPATTAWMGSDIHSVLSSSLYVINVICFNITNSIMRSSVMRANPNLGMEALLRGEKISLITNSITLLMTFFYPPFPFFGLGINMLLWFLPSLTPNYTFYKDEK